MILTVGAVVLAIVVLAGLCLAAFTAWTARRVERAVPPCGDFIEIDGTRVHFCDEGDGQGRDILLIHGLGGQLRNFRHSLTSILARDHRVVSIDRPGSGHSGIADEGRPNLDQQVAVLASAIDTLGLKQPVVVGHSLGGTLALALALEHPQKVASLALLAPLTYPQEEVPDIFKPLGVRPALLRRLLAWTVAVPSSIRRSNETLHAAFGPDEVPADFGTKGGGLLALRPKSFLTTASDFGNLPRFLYPIHKRYEELKLPVGILFGTGDRILDWRANGERMNERVEDLDLETIEGAGHMIPATRAARCAAFIERIAARPAPAPLEANPSEANRMR